MISALYACAFYSSRKMALRSFKLGNKQAAYRHIQQSKLQSETRSKHTSLLERVEEVLSVIVDAESTKKVTFKGKWLVDNIYIHSLKMFPINDWFSFTLNCQVSEAIQVGVQAIKEYNINVEEVQDQLQELDEHIKAQKEVTEVLGNASYLFNGTEQEGFSHYHSWSFRWTFCWGYIS